MALRALSRAADDESITETEFSQAYEYLDITVRSVSNRTWSIFANYVGNFTAPFSDKRLLELFSPGGDRVKVSPETIIDEGQLLLVSLSPTVYGGGEPYFLDRAREFRTMCILATQGLSAIASVLPDSSKIEHFLNNCRTKIFFATDCPATLEYFERLVGLADVAMHSHSVESQLPAPFFRLPNYVVQRSNQPQVTKRSSFTERRAKCTAAKLRALPNGTCVVVGKEGTVSGVDMGTRRYC